jgi:hypothetical protein
MTLKLTTYRRGADIPDLPNTNIFHSKKLFLLYEATPRYTPILVVAYRNDVPVAQLLGSIHRIMPFVSRCDIFDLGCYNADGQREELFSAMLDRMTTEALKSADIIQFRNLDNPASCYKTFREMGYFPVRWLKVRNSLHSQSSADARLSQSRIRQIRKAYRNGAITEEARDREDVRELIELMKRLYPQHNTFTNMDMFCHNISDRLVCNEQTKVFVVRYNGKIIGGSACVYSGNNAFLWFSGGMRKLYAMQYPGILAVWAALKDAYDRGLEHLEFMDVGMPYRRHGYRDFILRFGGKQSGTRRWFRFRSDWLNKILTKIYV